MEADWEIEIGSDAPVIEARWAGFIDLRAEPGRVGELAECNQLSGLADALVQLNAKRSPVWTSKCDVFDPNLIDVNNPNKSIDPDEFNSLPQEAQHAVAVYIDVVARDSLRWQLPSDAERDCRTACDQLRQIPLR